MTSLNENMNVEELEKQKLEAEIQKLQIEKAKIDVEIFELKKPFYRQTSFMNGMLATTLSIATVVLGYFLGGGKEYFDLQKLRLDTEIEKHTENVRKDSLNSKLIRDNLAKEKLELDSYADSTRNSFRSIYKQLEVESSNWTEKQIAISKLGKELKDKDLPAKLRVEKTKEINAIAESDLLPIDTSILSNAKTKKLAAEFSISPSALKAIIRVESAGNGISSNGKPRILFEGHIFWKQLMAKDINPKTIQKGNEDILYPVWNVSTVRPLYSMDQYQRLAKAIKINEYAAYASTSWGMFQIMGFNYRACGYNSIQDFVADQNNLEQQVWGFLNYLVSTHLIENVRQLDWKGFARAYNGPDYKANEYDIKLSKAYLEYSALQK